jgi:hypothetical protein
MTSCNSAVCSYTFRSSEGRVTCGVTHVVGGVRDRRDSISDRWPPQARCTGTGLCAIRRLSSQRILDTVAPAEKADWTLIGLPQYAAPLLRCETSQRLNPRSARAREAEDVTVIWTPSRTKAHERQPGNIRPRAFIDFTSPTTMPRLFAAVSLALAASQALAQVSEWGQCK